MAAPRFVQVQVKTFSLVVREKPQCTGLTETAFFPLPVGSRYSGKCTANLDISLCGKLPDQLWGALVFFSLISHLTWEINHFFSS